MEGIRTKEDFSVNFTGYAHIVLLIKCKPARQIATSTSYKRFVPLWNFVV